MKDKPRSGKPPTIQKETMMEKIKQELSDSSTGWDFRQVMRDIIQKRTGIKYHKVHIYRLLYKWGFVRNQRYLKRGL
jgi:transposase